MSVYVDDMKAGFGRMVMCHMIADSKEELITMVDAIGVDRKWIQCEDTPKEHFDICKSKRERAVKIGAIQISQMELAKKIISKRGMNCEICGIGMEQNATLFRVNAVGIKGIWRCREHLTKEQESKIDPTVKDIADIVEYK